MISAEEARRIVREQERQKNREIMMYVEAEIEKAIKKGKLSAKLPDMELPDSLKEELESLGYVVTTFVWSICAEKCTIIRWDKA